MIIVTRWDPNITMSKKYAIDYSDIVTQSFHPVKWINLQVKEVQL